MRFDVLTAVMAAVMAVFAAGFALAETDAVLVPVDPPVAVAPTASTKLAFTVGLGAQAAPGYFGSEDLVLGPTGAFGSLYLQFNGRDYGTIDPYAIKTGVDFGASLRFIGERSEELYPELAGLAAIDPALELGGGISYAQPAWEVFAEMRLGIGGHESTVGEVGMDLIARPTDELTLTAGPRLFLGSDDYSATYFGVTPAEAAASGFTAYDATGGLLAAGVELGAAYDLGNDWGLQGRVTWDRLQGSAADSPIVLQGSDDQFSAAIVATRRFSLEF